MLGALIGSILGAVVGAAIEGLGGLDVLVNSAGVVKVGLVEDIDEAFWDEMLDVNLKGTFFCIRAALASLRESRGNIVNVASDAGLFGDVDSGAVYCASKGGVLSLTRAWAREFAPDILVNCVAPGFISTAMTDALPDGQRERLAAAIPTGRFGEGTDVAAGCVYLASDEAGYVTGQTLHINGGMAMI